MALVDGLLMTSKFRGCLLGSLMGDCLGSPYEGSERDKPSSVVLQNFFDSLESSTVKAPQLQYTDDTTMTHCIAESLIEKEKVDAHDLAARFVKEYYNQPRRGYGQGVIDVFAKLRATKCRDPLAPAREQFGGSGSYGNGGAMRIAPVALFFRGQGTSVLGSMAQRATEVTHTHREGINGAILQCLAIEQSLWLNPKQPVDAGAFLEELIAKMQQFEEDQSDHEFAGPGEEAQPYTSRLRWAQSLLQPRSKPIDDDEDVRRILGCGVWALASVPTAIFCFLRAHQGADANVPHLKAVSPLRRTLQYAISLGGDTDTIGAMSGALCGAALGFSPEHFHEGVLKRCEGVEKALSLADGLQAKSSG